MPVGEPQLFGEPRSSPSTSLDAVAPAARAAAAGVRGPNRAVALRLALGSQESCSQGAGPGQLPSQLQPQLLVGTEGGSNAFGGTFGGPTPAPSPVGGALPPAAAAEAGIAAAAAYQLERLQLSRELPGGGADAAAGASAGAAAGPAAAGQGQGQEIGGEGLAEMGEAEAAMWAAGQIADDLAG